MDATSAVAVNALQTRQQISLAALKSSLDIEKQTAQLVSQVAGGAGGPQPLNSSGTGQIVNLIV